MKLIEKTNNGKNAASWLLEVTEVVLVLCNSVNSQYQQKSEMLFIFTSNKSYAYLLNAELSNLEL